MKKWPFLLLAVIAVIAFLVFNSGSETEESGTQDSYKPQENINEMPESPIGSERDIVAQGSIDTVTWKLTGDGTLTIGGTGAIPDYEKGATDQPWREYAQAVRALVVEDGITRIGHRAFQGCTNIVSARIGNTVTGIGQWAFQNCHVLTDLELPEDTVLETGAFRGTPVEWTASAAGSGLYADSSYNLALDQVKLTGDQREDVIQIALSQVGYHEGNSEADYAGGNSSGTGDYTEYGRRLGSTGTAWCSEFACWCIRMAGVPSDSIANSLSANVSNFTANTSATWYAWQDTAHSRGGYTPRKGDLLLWSWENGSYGTEENLSHTSIFWDLEVKENGNLILKTVDGNSNNQVQICKYEINAADGTLVGREGRLCYIIVPDYNSQS